MSTTKTEMAGRARMSRIESIVRHETVDAMQHRQQSDEKLDLILTKLTNLSSYPQVMTAERYPVVQPRTLAAVEPDLARSRIQDLSSQAYSNSLAIQEDTAIAALQCQQRRTDFCEDICNCVCHLRNRSWWRSPLILKNVVGFFFLGYSGLKFLKPACTSRGCRSYSSQVCRVTYYAPRWLLAKAVCIATGKTPYGDLFFILRVQSRTDYLAPNSLYRLAHRNDTRGIQEAFERRVANPNDADQYTGSTSLHVSLPGDLQVEFIMC